ncbi:telomerase reverse transcriptase isoform X3 [Ascaphus truei]|uniref:telomerase reverse transcriptase isoform X3 n=1 Tax=Ascaphus truei TaxID=8439 RepID=UPI003F59FBAB
MYFGEKCIEVLNIVQSLYGEVHGIVDFIKSLQTSGMDKVTVLHGGDGENYRTFLSELLVCIPAEAKPLCTPISFQQLSTQREVVARVIQRICEKKRRNVLAFGYGLIDEKSLLRVMFAPNVCSYFPNPTTATISTSALWGTLLSRIGDDVMMHLLEHCSLFMLVPSSCCYQISGPPIYNLSNDANLSPSWVRQRHAMTRNNVLFRYIQKKKFPYQKCFSKLNRWKIKKTNKKEKTSTMTAPVINKMYTNLMDDTCNTKALSSEATEKIKSTKSLCNMVILDIPAKKQRITLHEEGTRSRFVFKGDRDANPVTSVSCLDVYPKAQALEKISYPDVVEWGFYDVCKSNITNRCDTEHHPGHMQQVSDKAHGESSVKCSVPGGFKFDKLQHKCAKETSCNSLCSKPKKISPSRVFIERDSMLYSSRISKEGFLKTFLLTNLKSSSSGSQTLLETIFLNSSIFEQSYDQPCPVESTKKKKLPKRFWQMRHVFQDLIQNHKSCPYRALLKKHCPVRISKIHSDKLESLNKDMSLLRESAYERENLSCDAETYTDLNENYKDPYKMIAQSFHEAHKNISDTTKEKNFFSEKIKNITEESTFLDLLKQHNNVWQVYVFVRQCLNRVVPELLWGSSHNKCRFLNHVKTLIYSVKFGKISLSELLWKMRVEDCIWVRLKKGNHFVPASEHLLREGILAKFLYWLMDTYVIQLLRSFFYITETMFQKSKLFFYRKNIWSKLQNFGLRKYLANIKVRLISSEEIEDMQQQKNVPLVSRLRFIPKTNGLRPIAKMCNTLRAKQSKKSKAKKIQHFNTQVRNLFSVLNYERSRTSSLVGSSVFGLDDIYKTWRRFVLEVQESKAEKAKFYFVKTDVTGAYDTIPHSKLDEVVSKVISPNIEEAYCIRRYATLWTDSTGQIRKSFKQHVSTMVDFLPNMKQFASHLQNSNLMQNCILVEQSLCLNESSSKLLAFFQQIFCNHILVIKNQYYVQCCGIPQGSMLSTLLCSLCYGDMENKLFCGIQQNGTLAEGIPQYGCSISPHKTVVNFPIDDIPECSKAEQLSAHCLFPWCGLLLDTQTLEVYCDYSSYACTSIRSSLTFCHSTMAGKNMRHKLIRVLRLKCHSLFLDLKVNSLRTVCINVYKIFLLQAYRFHACVIQLPFNQSVRNNPRFFLTVISDMAPCLYTTLKAKNKNIPLGARDATCPFPFEAAQWLCCHAFITKLTNHKAVYKCLLGPLQTCKVQLYRRLSQDTFQLLKAVTDSSLLKDFSTIMD